MHHLSKVGLDAYGDDICGFKRTMPAECGFEDTINITYVFDNDGDPDGESWNKTISIRSVAGIRLIRTPSDTLEYSFNWWSAAPGPDFGPRKIGTLDRPFRDMNGFIGAPHGDRNKYDVMRNQEFDYDQLTGAVDHSNEGWLPPNPISRGMATGGDPKLLLSFGPFEIFPGETLPITYAFIAGENFLTGAANFAQTQRLNPLQPELYYSTLDFSDFGLNARWASWIYDNPGVDTDLDGNFGKFRVCVLEESLVVDSTLVIDSSVTPFDTSYIIDSVYAVVRADTVFYEGDGVPDFRGAAPPPAPDVRLTPSVGQIILRWNGFLSETVKDPFSDTTDFEGYRVYASPTLRRDDFTLYASYDKHDYNRYVYDEQKERFILIDAPFTLEQLKSFYGEAFDPLIFGIDNPFLFFHSASGTDSLYYFTPQDWNLDDLTLPDGIRKIFPDSPKPSSVPSEWNEFDTTSEGNPKFYEYEFVFKDIVPSSPLYIAVSAFDFGSPSSGLGSLESNPINNAVREYPMASVGEVIEKGLRVIVYPNPYRADGRYRELGHEGRGEEELPAFKVRALNFTNLPAQCEIKIYSLDGDLVGFFDHNFGPNNPGAMHDSWDLITRNTQLAVSGIYYYTVEEPNGNIQIGKFALIM
ncbi:MAG: hypothetical protein IIB00_08515 [candidate division Zixibacteria bacterium]|nr:hypothetical protein [candidate division Zixibacteria bacterium]